MVYSRRGALAAAAVAAGVVCGVHAQDSATPFPLPGKPIRMVVPFTPGGTNDMLGRLIAAKLTEQQGWATVVENRPGAGGAIGGSLVTNAAADGHTLMLISPSHVMIGAVQKLPYDPVKSFTAVSLVASGPSVVAVTQSLPVNTVAELVAYAKAKPGALNYSSSGVGSNANFIGELFNQAAGVKITHVAYKGGTPAITDLLAGQIQVFHGGIAAILPYIKAGKVKALGVTSRERSSAAPDIPEVQKTLPGFEAMIWYAVIGPPSMPAAVVAKLNAANNSIMSEPEVIKRLEAEGIQTVNSGSDAASRHLADEYTKWSAVAKESGIRPD